MALGFKESCGGRKWVKSTFGCENGRGEEVVDYICCSGLTTKGEASVS
jgi:hypothetical protein